ncbi:hypothetical protein GQ55_4G120500 [Panicum hallii var. hallii]|uniref:Uncharacterized protein n=1 Tax=Panicum hallii var. hallii TaxID=1504633 RepID=A0A2T7DXS3_9POAL|nr:hypothetical protein GQ55_4G120500 [Panicum hallii var. hallii]
MHAPSTAEWNRLFISLASSSSPFISACPESGHLLTLGDLVPRPTAGVHNHRCRRCGQDAVMGCCLRCQGTPPAHHRGSDAVAVAAAAAGLHRHHSLHPSLATLPPPATSTSSTLTSSKGQHRVDRRRESSLPQDLGGAGSQKIITVLPRASFSYESDGEIRKSCGLEEIRQVPAQLEVMLQQQNNLMLLLQERKTMSTLVLLLQKLKLKLLNKNHHRKHKVHN